MVTIKQKQKKQNQLAIMLGTVLVFLVGGGIYFYSAHAPISRDPVTNCEIGGPTAYTAIIFDQSEAFPYAAVQEIRRIFDAFLSGRSEDINFADRALENTQIEFNRNAFSSNSQLQLYVMNEDAINSNEGVEPIFLGNGDSAIKCLGPWGDSLTTLGALFVNADMLTDDKREIIEAFNEEIDAVLTDDQGNSPIMEMVAAVSRSNEFAREFEKPHYLIIISDFIQEMPNYSHRRSNINFDSWVANSTINGSFLNTEVQMIYVRRPDDSGIQNHLHISFWERFFNSINLSPSYFLYTI